MRKARVPPSARSVADGAPRARATFADEARPARKGLSVHSGPVRRGLPGRPCAGSVTPRAGHVARLHPPECSAGQELRPHLRRPCAGSVTPRAAHVPRLRPPPGAAAGRPWPLLSEALPRLEPPHPPPARQASLRSGQSLPGRLKAPLSTHLPPPPKSTSKVAALRRRRQAPQTNAEERKGTQRNAEERKGTRRKGGKRGIERGGHRACASLRGNRSTAFSRRPWGAAAQERGAGFRGVPGGVPGCPWLPGRAWPCL